MSYEVTIEPTGEVIDVDEGQTILDAALRQGVWLPFACGHGICGTCKVQVLEGDAEVGDASPFALMDMEREEGFRLACCCTPDSDLVIEADVDEDPDFAGHQVMDWTATVMGMETLTPTIRAVRLRLPEAGMRFQAGQYVNLQLPGVDGARAFSIATVPSNPNEIELHIRKVPGGVATTWIHEALEVGQTLELSGPYGQFFVRKSDPKDVIFIAGGSGLSSPESMILDLLGDPQDTRKITLFQGARNTEELYHRERFEQLAQGHERFTYVPALNDPREEDSWDGFVGFVHEAAVAHFDGRFNGHKAYLCGPPLMIDAAISALMQGRLFERDIHMERFFTAADGAEKNTRSALFKRI
ncbi:NADH:ubiquinone reductase (Na(+)-transporting) subunit F [Halomonas halocynthiae]|uniref:NADH:ubiquinone reductase (Na(+)-transporting) subunit F n=1 Tax=Halomonas halocynthiae TaxID=176290 RepID=UPI0003F6E82C|nr:phenol 2-monooxygenase domain-containing protein [Halomonas halocynthiae]